MFHSKVVVRTGFGMYYDRGELFSYFSPGYAIGTVTGGPFGVNQSLPFVNDCRAARGRRSICTRAIIPTCGGGRRRHGFRHSGGRWAIWRIPTAQSRSRRPKNPKSSDLVQLSAKPDSIENPGVPSSINGGQPISLGVYDRANKLPYTYNYTLDIQWQPRNDLAIEIGYVGNLGRHQVIPVPFNQPGIAIADHSDPRREVQLWIYGEGGVRLPNGGDYAGTTYEGGNVDHRVPYIGYAAESIDYKAAGIDSLQRADRARGQADEPRTCRSACRIPTRMRWTSRAAWACSTTATIR